MTTAIVLLAVGAFIFLSIRYVTKKRNSSSGNSGNGGSGLGGGETVIE